MSLPTPDLSAPVDHGIATEAGRRGSLASSHAGGRDQLAQSHPECAVCNKRHAYRNSVRGRYRAAGLCAKCGKVRSRYVMCRSCREADNANKKAKREARRHEQAA